MSTSAIRKVLVLHRESLVAPGAPSLSVSARITEVLDYLADFGSLEHCAVSEDDPCAERAVHWADVMVLSKHRSARALDLVRMARMLGKGIVYDVDDWIFSFPSYSGGGGTVANHTLEIIALSHVLTVANKVLLRRLPDVVPQARLVLMPNGMWVERYEEGSAGGTERRETPRVVFTNADFLKVQESKDAILSALNVFFMRHPDWILDFFGDPFPEMFSLPFLHFTNRMPYQEYMRAIVAGGYMFAITPLGADEDAEAAVFNACKNPFKYINYSVAGIPGIYSRASIYRDCVVPGETGLLVENRFETWLDAMERFASSAALRDRISRAAHANVIDSYHVRAAAQVFSFVLDDLLPAPGAFESQASRGRIRYSESRGERAGVHVTGAKDPFLRVG